MDIRTIAEALSAITPSPAEQAARDAAHRQWASIAKPLGSLGLLEDTIVQIAALTGNVDVDLSRRALLVFCADNGVVAQGVTQSDSSVTVAVAQALAAETIVERPFRPIGEEAFQRAVSVMERCQRVLCPVAEFGEMNEKNRLLREIAREAGKLEA